MASSFSVLSLKRNRSSSSSKGSKINTFLNKLASPFHHDSKKRKQQLNQESKKNSFGLFIDYFRSEDSSYQLKDNPFANDTLFERNRYTTTKNQRQNDLITPLKHDSKISITQEQQPKSIITKNSNISLSNKSGILVKQPPISFINNGNQKNHRHTNSTLSVQSSKSAYRKGRKSSHVRHYSHVSCMSASNITVNSENLTAKEFADIAGIRILSEDEEYSSTVQSYRDDKSNKIVKRCAFCDEADDTPMHSSMIVTSRYNDMDDDEEDEGEDEDDNYTNHSSPLETIQDNDLNIWDLDFWQQPGDFKPSYVNQNEVEEELPILHQLRRNSIATEQKNTIIKKGRFEIQLSHCNHQPTTTTTTTANTTTTTANTTTTIANSEKAVPSLSRPDVMEWKRKKRPTTTLKHQITI